MRGNTNRVISDNKQVLSFAAAFSSIGMDCVLGILIYIRIRHFINSAFLSKFRAVFYLIYPFFILAFIAFTFYDFNGGAVLGRGWYAPNDPTFNCFIGSVAALNCSCIGILNLIVYKQHNALLKPSKGEYVCDSCFTKAALWATSTVHRRTESEETGVQEKDVHKLDGLLLLPRVFSQFTIDEILKRSNTPPQKMHHDTEWIARGTTGSVIYFLDKGYLYSVTVDGKYPTTYLGINSGNPEQVLLRSGYEMRIETDPYTYFTYPAVPNYHVAVDRQDGRLNEVICAASNMAEFIHQLVPKIESDKIKEEEMEAGRLILELVHIGSTIGFFSQRQRTREIGKRLNEIGGFKGMQLAAHRVMSMAGARPGSDLEWVWDGIGQWQR